MPGGGAPASDQNLTPQAAPSPRTAPTASQRTVLRTIEVGFDGGDDIGGGSYTLPKRA
jgi:hypothetical protein